MQRGIRFGITLPAVLVGALWMRLLVAVDRRRGTDPARGRAMQAQAAWCRWFCRFHRIRIETPGVPLAGGPILLVANHVSWLDIIVLTALQPVIFLSKSEVARWPLIGPVATGLGTLYIERGRRAAAGGAIAAMADGLRAGRGVVFFPEGTTSDGRGVLAFRSRLFQAALDTGAPVQPLVLRYLGADGKPCSAVPYVGGQSLLANFWAITAVSALRAQVTAAEPIPVGAGLSRSELARRAHGVIERRLQCPS